MRYKVAHIHPILGRLAKVCFALLIFKCSLLHWIFEIYYFLQYLCKITLRISLMSWMFFWNWVSCSSSNLSAFTWVLCSSCSWSTSATFEINSFLNSLILRNGMTEPQRDWCQKCAFQRLKPSSCTLNIISAATPQRLGW